MTDAVIQSLTDLSGLTIFPRTSVDAVQGLDDFTSDLETRIPKLLNQSITITNSQWDSTTKMFNAPCGIATSSNNLIIAPAPSSYEVWGDCKIRAISQENGYIKFQCVTIPDGAISVNIMALE